MDSQKKIKVKSAESKAKESAAAKDRHFAIYTGTEPFFNMKVSQLAYEFQPQQFEGKKGFCIICKGVRADLVVRITSKVCGSCRKFQSRARA